MRDEIEFKGEVLICPVCKNENLHQESVEVLLRAEDTDAVLHTVKRGEVESRPIAADESIEITRRDYVRIRFWCEHCGPNRRVHLLVVQHKGATLVRWGAGPT